MKKLILILVLFVAGLAFLVYYLRQQEFTVVISEAELQRQIEGAFPVERQYMLVVTLRLSEPQVALIEGADRIHYGMRATASGAGQRFSGQGRVSGGLRYDPETRRLYLQDSIVEELEIDGLPSRYRTVLREGADLVAGQHLDRHPIYTIDEEFLAQLPGPVELRDIRVRDGKVRAVFGVAGDLNLWERLVEMVRGFQNS